MESLEFISYACVGAISGFISGFLGIGGGVIMIPTLFFLLRHFGIAHTHLMHIAIGTALTSMIFSSISSVFFHHKNKKINWAFIKHMLLGIFTGSVLGAYIAQILSTHLLAVFFGICLIVIGLKFLFWKDKEVASGRFPSLSIWMSNTFALAISFLAALLGLGGGVFAVSFFNMLKMPMRQAIANSAVMTLITTFIASICYFLFGLEYSPLHFENHRFLGFIYLPALLWITVFSVPFSPLGVKMLHWTNVALIKKIFGVILILVGFSMF